MSNKPPSTMGWGWGFPDNCLADDLYMCTHKGMISFGVCKSKQRQVIINIERGDVFKHDGECWVWYANLIDQAKEII